MIECLRVDKRLFDVDIRRNYTLQDADVRVQSAYTDAVNEVYLQLSYVPLQTKLYFIWIMNVELVRMKNKEINNSYSVSKRATGFDYNGMPSEVLRYILDFLSVTQARHIALENTPSNGNVGRFTMLSTEDPLFTTRNNHWSLRDSSWV